MISVTSDRKVAEYFAGPQGILIEPKFPNRNSYYKRCLELTKVSI